MTKFKTKKSTKKFVKDKLASKIKERKAFQRRRDRSKRVRTEMLQKKSGGGGGGKRRVVRKEEGRADKQQQREQQREEDRVVGEVVDDADDAVGEAPGDFHEFLEQEMQNWANEQDEEAGHGGEADGDDDNDDEDIDLEPEDDDDDMEGDDEDGSGEALDSYDDLEDGDVMDEGDDYDEDDDDDEGRQADLEYLRNSDPEFFKYLTENDPTLLQQMQDAADGNDEDDDQEEDGDARRVIKIPRWMRKVSVSVGRESQRALSRGARQFVACCKALNASSRPSKASRDDDGEAVPKFSNRFSPGYIELIVRWALGPGIKALVRSKRGFIETEGARFYVGIKALLLGGSAWVALVLECAHQDACWKVMLRCKRFRHFASSVLKLWAQPNEDDGDSMQKSAFLALRSGVINSPHPYSTQLVRAAHVYVANSASGVSAFSLSRLGWLCAALAELHSLLGAPLQYQLLYVALRQQALQLRQLLTAAGVEVQKLNKKAKKGKNGEDKKAPKAAVPYTWPLIVSLRSTALCLRDANDVLRPLLYPALHVLQGFVQLTKSPTWLPAQLLCLDCMLLLASQVYVPISSAALRMLTGVLTSSAGGKPPTVPLAPSSLRISRAGLTQRGIQQDNIVVRHLDIILRDASLRARHVSYPEWSVPITRQLHFLCNYAPPRAARMIRQLASVLDANARHILKIRSKMALTPREGATALRALQDDPTVTPLETYIAQRGVPKDFLFAVEEEYAANVGKQQIQDQEGDEGNDDEDERRVEQIMDEDEDEIEPVASWSGDEDEEGGADDMEDDDNDEDDDDDEE